LPFLTSSTCAKTLELIREVALLLDRMDDGYCATDRNNIILLI